ncbi:MAG TPA: phosphomannomutase/phosphoglucomutase [Acidobacteriota bacterium]|nr:phosphomannomutase/phosphoglucomutase [Acidobacteriota bacterium]
MKSEIFREYDIRGVADSDLTEDAIVMLGRAIGTYLKRNGCSRMALGRDVRLSSRRLRDNIVEGVLSTGLDIVDVGECPTPLLYFALHHLKADGGVMITGSHNPPEYNGFKIALGMSTIHGEQIQEIRKVAEAEDFENGAGGLETKSVLQPYLDDVTGRLGRFSRKIRVVVDCGNGTGGIVAKEFFEALGCEMIPLYCEVDGHFPNHHPDPTVEEFLQDLIRVVAESKADLGIAFDGDSDRIGAVDDTGRIIWGDELMILYARAMLQEYPGATVVAEVKCSKNLYDDIEKRGGKAIMWKAGHSLLKAKMKEEGALLGGEMSGHIYFADRYYGFDDAFYAGARLIEICADSELPLSQMLDDLPVTYSTPEIRVDCPEELKFKVVKRAQEYFQAKYDAVTIDGVRVLFEDGWGLVRASNTQAILVLRFEAETEERLKEIRSLIEKKLEEFMREESSGA